VLDNFAAGRRENLLEIAHDIELVEGDMQSYERAHNAVKDWEIALHLGALPSVPRSGQDPLTSNATNVTGTLNVLLAARDAGVRRVVHASSSSDYGASPELSPGANSATSPRSPLRSGCGGPSPGTGGRRTHSPTSPPPSGRSASGRASRSRTGCGSRWTGSLAERRSSRRR
jgi:nucleoside-diphosphate-sugar epimerase